MVYPPTYFTHVQNFLLQISNTDTWAIIEHVTLFSHYSFKVNYFTLKSKRSELF